MVSLASRTAPGRVREEDAFVRKPGVAVILSWRELERGMTGKCTGWKERFWEE